MRKLTISRPYRKLRGLKREFAELRMWAGCFKNMRFASATGAKYFNFKAPVSHCILDGPRATHKIRASVFCELVRAAENLSNSPEASRHPYFGVAILMQLPGMFDAEVTLFLEQEYHHSFCYPMRLTDADRPSKIFACPLPECLSFESGARVAADEFYPRGQDYWTLTSPEAAQLAIASRV